MNRSFVCALLVAAAACSGGRDATMWGFELASNGYIKISGGCECYTEGLITFRPAFGDAVEVEVDNSRGWFYENNEPLESFTFKMDTGEAALFFEELKYVLDNPIPTDTCSTRAAVIEVYLPFRDDTVVETTWRELDMKQDVDLLVGFLEDFVGERHEGL
jgi:hypothetical protein